MAKKQTIDFGMLEQNNYQYNPEKIELELDKDAVVQKPVESNLLSQKFGLDNSIKTKKSIKVFEYKAVFNFSLEDQKKKSITTSPIFESNTKKLNVLKSLNPDITKTELLNYIIHDFFTKNNAELSEELKILRASQTQFFE